MARPRNSQRKDNHTHILYVSVVIGRVDYAGRTEIRIIDPLGERTRVEVHYTWPDGRSEPPWQGDLDGLSEILETIKREREKA